MSSKTLAVTFSKRDYGQGDQRFLHLALSTGGYQNGAGDIIAHRVEKVPGIPLILYFAISLCSPAPATGNLPGSETGIYFLYERI